MVKLQKTTNEKGDMTLSFEFRYSVESANDKCGEGVLSRLRMAHSDLHAAGAVYHSQFNSNFRTGKQMPQTVLNTSEDN